MVRGSIAHGCVRPKMWSPQNQARCGTHLRYSPPRLSTNRVPILRQNCHICRHFLQWSQPGSNRRPPACKAGALPAELWPQESSIYVPTCGFPIAGLLGEQPIPPTRDGPPQHRAWCARRRRARRPDARRHRCRRPARTPRPTRSCVRAARHVRATRRGPRPTAPRDAAGAPRAVAPTAARSPPARAPSRRRCRAALSAAPPRAPPR